MKISFDHHSQNYNGKPALIDTQQVVYLRFHNWADKATIMSKDLHSDALSHDEARYLMDTMRAEGIGLTRLKRSHDRRVIVYVNPSRVKHIHRIMKTGLTKSIITLDLGREDLNVIGNLSYIKLKLAIASRLESGPH